MCPGDLETEHRRTRDTVDADVDGAHPCPLDPTPPARPRVRDAKDDGATQTPCPWAHVQVLERCCESDTDGVAVDTYVSTVCPPWSGWHSLGTVGVYPVTRPQS